MKQMRKLPLGIQSFTGILFFILPILFFTSCKTGKTVQRQMQGIQSELFYELTTPVYSENIDHTIYLNPIEDSTIIPSTVVKRKGGKVIPLIVYNFSQDDYEVTLGDASLTQPYHDFLTDALLAQCNRSSCFDLIERDDTVLPDSALILEVKVNKNSTTVKMIDKEASYFIPGFDFISGYSKWEIEQPVSWLEISARLMRQENCLWEKTYAITRDLPYKREGIENPVHAYEACIDHMAECLSYTTKDIVENISLNLHLLMLREPAD
ncbi:MAG: hypothetical protein FWF53_02590 [Candidatus Azobacteroides sp.]|nr:hypothetical protein [Candidatus Azobacteroides sp.]